VAVFITQQMALVLAACFLLFYFSSLYVVMLFNSLLIFPVHSVAAYCFRVILNGFGLCRQLGSARCR